MTTEENIKLLVALAECQSACIECATACLDEKDVSKLIDCIKLDHDCADVCSITISFVARQSQHAEQMRDECEEICTHCADECEKHAEMEHCKKCAEKCRECAKLCRYV